MTEQPSNAEATEAKGLIQDSGVVNRAGILRGLDAKVKQLDRWTTQPHTIKSPIRVTCVRAEIYAYSVMLQGLHDKELDDLAAEIEAIKKHVGMVEKHERSELH